MSTARFTEEFKLEAVKQVTEYKRPVADVAQRLGVSTHSLYAWLKRYGKPAEQRQQASNDAAELRRLRAEVKRLTEERNILKKATTCSPTQPGCAPKNHADRFTDEKSGLDCSRLDGDFSVTH